MRTWWCSAKTASAMNTFENPRVYPEGIDYVLVNGEIAVDHGVHTGARPGKTIRD